MGLKTIKIREREAIELACDNVAHRGEQRVAWFECGSDLADLWLAMAAGWERKANGMWLSRDASSKVYSGTDRVIVPTKRAAAKAPPSATANERFARPLGKPDGLLIWCLSGADE